MAVGAAWTFASANPCRVIAALRRSSETPFSHAIKTPVRWLSCRSGVGVEMRSSLDWFCGIADSVVADIRNGSAVLATFSLIHLCLTDRSKTASSMG
ncbi:hypothetical protein [Mesorhizobium comanense]|mgnify:CR=1 FL=1|jgi:hypothetical protein|uniref:hypothetical protein n=1 Tax=Mesorhizobium comanense TaxID=2502215 RepID=UPI0010F9E502|nr:hypothetical protein [Mesorhizobium comanense]